MDDDRPYLLETDHGTIAEIPPHWSWDDYPQYAYLWEPGIGKTVVPPSTAVKVWAEELDALREPVARSFSTPTPSCPDEHPASASHPRPHRTSPRLGRR